MEVYWRWEMERMKYVLSCDGEVKVLMKKEEEEEEEGE